MEEQEVTYFLVQDNEVDRMTDSLYIIFDTQLDSDSLASELESFVKLRCSGQVPENLLQHFWCSISKTNKQATIQPFFSNVAFRALYDRKNKRTYMKKALSEIMNWIKLSSEKVDIVFCREGADKHNPMTCSTSTLDDVLGIDNPPSQHQLTVNLEPLKFFYVSQVEMSLDNPIDLGYSQPAIGYFRNYYVVARNEELALEFVIEAAGADQATFIGYKYIDQIQYYSLSPEIEEAYKSLPQEQGIFYQSGRVYFAE